ncbi:MAG TPA: dienelactone hydrolase family protein, partial [Nitrospiria bacterium]|nr:dienelactone hydrolase family protein [Nitrospiria bacterium]
MKKPFLCAIKIIFIAAGFGFSIAGCQSLPTSRDLPPPPPGALELIEAYFNADPEETGPILETIAGRDFDETEMALRYYLTHGFSDTVPIGVRPGRTLHMGLERINYGLFVPETYTPDRAYPLIICLHGAGFSGDAYLDRWRPRLGEEFILACPSVPMGNWWTPAAEKNVLAVLDQLLRTYNIDTDRVFLTGMSNGGNGTFLIGLNHADRFAALVPMAGAFPEPLYPMLDNAQTVPLYIIHGSKDHIMPVEYSRKLTAYLTENNRPVTYREHDRAHHLAGGHFFPREELPDLVSWLRKKKRKPVPESLVLTADRDHSGRLFWIRLDEISNEAGSFWASEYYPEEGEKLKQGAYGRMEAAISDNLVMIVSERIIRFSLLIHPKMIDFKRPVH